MSSRHILNRLANYESRNVTFLDPQNGWPIVWSRAKGVHVWDVEGRRYLDFTSAFGVASAGHANPAVVKAGQRQLAQLPHAMGDVHPHALKGDLARELSRLTFERWHRRRGKTIFCNSGFEAVEAALKTARLMTGKRGVIAFEGAYHGLGYGALNSTHRDHFRRPFLDQLGGFADFAPFPTQVEEVNRSLNRVGKFLQTGRFGAVLIEPVQGRGGVRVSPSGFLKGLRRLCTEHRVLMVADEIYTGFARTGAWFASDHDEVIPDLICVGKALSGGFPISAMVGRADVMDQAWPESTGEAIHTSTFLGNPVGCAMALAQLKELARLRCVARASLLGGVLMKALQSSFRDLPGLRVSVRGRGLMIGMHVENDAGEPQGERVIAVVKSMLQRGFVLLPEGEFGEVISLAPPLVITRAQALSVVSPLKKCLLEA